MPNKILYQVKNKITGEIKSRGTTLENVKRQVRF